MSLESLFDSTVRVWRASSAKGELREEVRTYAPVTGAPTDLNAFLARPRMPYSDPGPGPGLAPQGTRMVYMPAETDVEALDVLEVTSGPDAPCLLQVNEPPTRPRDHHAELRCLAWNGELEPAEGS